MEPTEWMLRGIELEPEARSLFEFEMGLVVDQVGFITNEGETAGCSPDGLTKCTVTIEVDEPPRIVPYDTLKQLKAAIDIDCGFEVKCPKASTHFGYLRAGVLPPYYAPQVHFSMAVTGIGAWWFMSYYPGLDPLIVTVWRDDYTKKVADAIALFSARLEAESKRFGLPAR